MPTSKPRKPAASDPRCDGTRVTFETNVGGTIVPCAISRSALQDLGGYRHFSAADLLRCFANARPRIEAIATRKFAARPESVYGVVSIWSDDLDDAEDAPADTVRAEPTAQHA